MAGGRYYLKRLIWIGIGVITAVCSAVIAFSHLAYTEFVTDNALKGEPFWAGRQTYQAPQDNPFLPLQIPGPADTWAGGEPKSVVLPYSQSGRLRLELNLFDSHESAPPQIQVLVNGHAVGLIKTRPGSGTNFPSWFFDGTPSSYSLVIPARLPDQKEILLTLRSVAGSWAAIRSLKLFWEPSAWVYYLAWAGMLTLLFAYAVFLTRKRLWGRHALNAALAAGATLLALAAVEMGLAYFWPQQEFVPNLRVVYIPDPDTGFLLKPSVKTGVGLDTNSLGLRDYERYSRAKPKGAYRILCLGDSFTFSYTMLADSYPKLLEKMLAQKNRRVEVLNAGIPGYGTDNQYYYLQKYGLGLEPDLVILGFFVGNDITDNYEHPSYTAINGVLFTLDKAKRYTPRQLDWEARKQKWLNRFHLVRFARNRNYQGVYRILGRREAEIRRQMNAAKGSCVQVTGKDVHTEPDSFAKPIQRGWQNTVKYLDAINKLTRDRGVRLLIVLIPDVMQFDTPEVRDIKAKLGTKFHWGQPQQALREQGERRSWPLLDALGPMRAQWDGSMLFYCQNSHFNERGNRLLATVIKDWLEKNRPELFKP